VYEPSLARALCDFERQFQYPLGQDWFRICHGEDYSRFYQSLGLASHVVVQDDSGIVAVCGAVIRELYEPAQGLRKVLYLGDLKIAAHARGGRVLWSMVQALQHHYEDIDSAFCVVMRGNTMAPDNYSGRAGLPAFDAIGSLRIWRLAVEGGTWAAAADAQVVSATQGMAAFRRLAGQHNYCLAGQPQRRSCMAAQWWMTADRRACGRLEDTRRAKQLFGSDGREMLSAHVGAFAFSDPASAGRLLQTLCAQVNAMACPALFLALPEDCRELPALLEQPPMGSIVAGATVYGCGLGAGQPWSLSTSEI